MFVGREEELAKLENLYQKDAFQMVVVYGRRRVGKTALINRFASDKRALYFTALDQADGITSLISAASYMSSLGCRAGPGPLSRGMPPSTSWRSAPSPRGSCSYSTSFPTPPGATAPCLLCFRLRLTASSRRRTSSLSCAAATRGSWRARSSVGRAPPLWQENGAAEGHPTRLSRCFQDASGSRPAGAVSLLRVLRWRSLLPGAGGFDALAARQPGCPVL